jgi:hypothetical protein
VAGMRGAWAPEVRTVDQGTGVAETGARKMPDLAVFGCVSPKESGEG